ncbi:hypothetical protein ROHU_036483 [Labeo rohita]|uniref:Uncharacterized protein n=1 Tax=Labeo rohita TaxID=84645 RepID=A0A498MVW5_LABRO|nr:hypothetical protein ROHU_036483 [Labeo rohita]
MCCNIEHKSWRIDKTHVATAERLDMSANGISHVIHSEAQIEQTGLKIRCGEGATEEKQASTRETLSTASSEQAEQMTVIPLSVVLIPQNRARCLQAEKQIDLSNCIQVNSHLQKSAGFFAPVALGYFLYNLILRYALAVAYQVEGWMLCVCVYMCGSWSGQELAMRHALTASRTRCAEPRL